MNWEYKSLLPADFSPSARVWVYQASRLFTISEVLHIEGMLSAFIRSWQSHGAAVEGFATLFFGRFVVLMADEAVVGVSGCSTDSSVRVVKAMEAETGVPLFDRQMLAFVRDDKVELLPLGQLAYAWQNGFIGPDTIFFDNTVATKKELEERWMVPVGKSWLQARLGKEVMARPSR
ncbi:MAG: hypothetical protein FJX89_10395 [Bacteroidetes bacterium]|nr:hypothetical protein [Bacteroidota bacterium]